MKTTRLMVAAVFIALCSTPAWAADNQAREARSLVDSAIALFRDQGKDHALKAINDKHGPLVSGEMYVFALTMDNVMVGHPHEFTIRRINMNNFKDAVGTEVFQKFKEVVETQGSGWVEYMWAKPGETNPSPKRSFVKKVPDTDLYVGAGYYLPAGTTARTMGGTGAR
jgi:cytochrome c